MPYNTPLPPLHLAPPGAHTTSTTTTSPHHHLRLYAPLACLPAGPAQVPDDVSKRMPASEYEAMGTRKGFKRCGGHHLGDNHLAGRQGDPGSFHVCLFG